MCAVIVVLLKSGKIVNIICDEWESDWLSNRCRPY